MDKHMIRKAELKDLAALVQIGQRFHAESEHYSRLSYSGLKVFFMLKSLLTNDDAMLIVIEKDGLIIGGMAAMVFAEWYSNERLATDICIFILPEHRGTSSAIELIEHYKSWAKERNAKYSLLSISTGINVERTQGLYEKLGAKRIGPVMVID
jgi:GNAT superfamily N-acetyltransferase